MSAGRWSSCPGPFLGTPLARLLYFSPVRVRVIMSPRSQSAFPLRIWVMTSEFTMGVVVKRPLSLVGAMSTRSR